LSYYGVITNNCGEDWKEAKLSLSTATPAVGGTPPPLPTAKVTFQNAYTNRGHGSDRFSPSSHNNPVWSNQNELHTVQMTVMEDSYAEDQVTSAPTAMPTTADEGITSSTFTIPRAATILSDNKPHKVTVAIVDLKSRFTYSAVPRRSQYVYLKATTTNTSDYALLAGSINVFMDNNFVATSTVKAVNVKEDFAVFLGIDNGLKVQYKPVKKMKEVQGYISKINSETVSRVISIKNSKSVDVLVVVYEQVPLSSDEKIKVKLIEPDPKKEKNVTLNASNNLEWRLTIAAGQKQDLDYQCIIEWPQNKEVTFDTGFQ